jgi:hypothetical protein
MLTSSPLQAYHQMCYPFEAYMSQRNNPRPPPAAPTAPSQNLPPNQTQGGYSQGPAPQSHPAQQAQDQRPGFQTMPPPSTSAAQGSPSVYPLSLPGGPQGVPRPGQMKDDKGKGKAMEAEKRKVVAKGGPLPKTLKRGSSPFQFSSPETVLTCVSPRLRGRNTSTVTRATIRLDSSTSLCRSLPPVQQPRHNPSVASAQGRGAHRAYA